mmetsp:Transcript_1477/g.3345  ORF Transcript_1477/g.3345 Transcript_1477/m.3345 type:complete len:443 (-) Transcript_1477:338-1666(-)
MLQGLPVVSSAPTSHAAAPRPPRVNRRGAELGPRRGIPRTRHRHALGGNSLTEEESAAESVATMALPLQRTAWVVNKTGALSGLARVHDEIAAPAEGEVRVRVRAIGLNFADVFSVLGLYQATPPTPFVPGLECCGVVEAVGPPAKNLPEGTVVPQVSVGDCVMAVARFGAYATVVNVPVHQTHALPAGWSFEEGAGFLVQGLTAFYALSALGNVRRGHTVLVHSAAGGCGLFGLGICKAVGAHAIATVGSASKAAVIRQRFPEYMPAERIIVRDRKKFGAQVKEAAEMIAVTEGSAEGSVEGSESGGGCDIVMDAVMGDYFRGGWDNLARGGRYVVFGAADLTPAGDLGVLGWIALAWKYIRRPFVDPMNLPGDNKSVMGFNLIWMFDKTTVLGELLRDLTQLCLPAPKVGQCFTFEELPEALRTFQGGNTTGKCVIVVPE